MVINTENLNTLANITNLGFVTALLNINQKNLEMNRENLDINKRMFEDQSTNILLLEIVNLLKDIKSNQEKIIGKDGV